MAKGWRLSWVLSPVTVFILCCMAPLCHAELKTHQIKAAYLYQISKFVFWPEERKQTDSFRVCQLGPDSYGGTLQKMVGCFIYPRQD